MSRFDLFVQAVEAATHKPARRSGANLRLLCPCHPDTNPSLDVREAADHSPLVRCRVCNANLTAVCSALGPDQRHYLSARAPMPSSTPPPKAFQAPAGATHRYDYTDADGNVVLVVWRIPQAGGKKTFRQGVPDTHARPPGQGPRGDSWHWPPSSIPGYLPPLYKLDSVRAAIAAGQPVYVVEGEKDADAIHEHGAVATCNPMGAGKWQPQHTRELAQATVRVIADQDDPGRAHARRVAADLAAAGATTQILAPLTGKDAHDHLEAGHTLEQLVPQAPDPEPELEQPPVFGLTLHEFLAVEYPQPEPLLGTRDEQIIPAGGLVIVGGRAGIGKTTMLLDAAFHLASGHTWLRLPCPRPLAVALVENEGPIHLFQSKLRHKASKWQLDLNGEIHVQTWRWGSFTFDDPTALELANGYLDQHQVDVVIGDPLNTLGVRGVGSPEDTREFVKHLVTLGLWTRRAFVFLHHLRKQDADDEIDAISGAWGGHLDTLIVVKPTASTEQIRVSFPKVRWLEGKPERKPLILAKQRDTASFTIAGEESIGPASRAEEIAQLLSDGRWRTRLDIAERKRGGLGIRREIVERELRSNPHLFRSLPGPQVGLHPQSIAWQLVDAHAATDEQEQLDADEWWAERAEQALNEQEGEPDT